MGRHSAAPRSLLPRLLRLMPVRPLHHPAPADQPPADTDQLALHLVPRPAEEVESAEDVEVLYPDGATVPVDWRFDGRDCAGRHRRYVVGVPDEAHLATGMLIRAGAVILPVALRATQPTTEDRVAGGLR